MIVRRHSLFGFFVGHRRYQFCDHFAKIFYKNILKTKKKLKLQADNYCRQCITRLIVKLANNHSTIVSCREDRNRGVGAGLNYFQRINDSVYKKIHSYFLFSIQNNMRKKLHLCQSILS